LSAFFLGQSLEEFGGQLIVLSCKSNGKPKKSPLPLHQL